LKESQVNHARQPQLCDECLNKLTRGVEDGAIADKSYWYCPHESTVTKLKIKNRTIVSWQLFGPRTIEEALFFCASVVAIKTAQDLAHVDELLKSDGSVH
jgi:hypothetical protein